MKPYQNPIIIFIGIIILMFVAGCSNSNEPQEIQEKIYPRCIPFQSVLFDTAYYLNQKKYYNNNNYNHRSTDTILLINSTEEFKDIFGVQPFPYIAKQFKTSSLLICIVKEHPGIRVIEEHLYQVNEKEYRYVYGIEPISPLDVIVDHHFFKITKEKIPSDAKLTTYHIFL
ncbi:MAG: hypothetical protein GX372_05645 [Ignavibacteria bacterium]|jgi:hypothetical protein|nr:hypothetical protein [Ignavibacteria bacterium]